jgi:putative nucleotidyltransferase with HDIG domain
MHEGLTMDLQATATVRLAAGGWTRYIQQACARLRAASAVEHRAARDADGIQTLVGRLRRTRPTTYQHCLRVARISHSMGRAYGFDETRLRQLASTAMMHDIGKILVPESILLRPRKPTRLEQFILHLHPSFGALLAAYFNLSPELRIRTEHHHERWDGKGYPHRLGGRDIPLMARIVQVADTYDAMVSRRAYNRPRTHAEAVAELRQHTGTQFDPRVVEAFLDTFPVKQDGAR